MFRPDLLYLIRPYNLTTGQVEAFRFSRSGYGGFEPVIVSDLVFTDAYPDSQGIIGGAQSANFGKITIKHPVDGRGRYRFLDFNERYAFGMREIEIQERFRGKITTIFQGLMTYAQADREKCDIHIGDYAYLLEKPFHKETYSASDLAPYPNAAEKEGAPKPELLGEVNLIEPVQLSVTVRHISIGPIQAVDGVFDNGVAITFQQDLTGAAFDGFLPDPGHYVTDLSRGLIKLGSSPFGQITVCAKGRRFDDGAGGLWYPQTHGGVLKAKLTECEVPIDTVALDALATGDPHPMGAYVTSETEIQSFVDIVARSCGATTGNRLDGRFFAELFPGVSGSITVVIPSESVIQSKAPNVYKARKGFDIGFGNRGDISSITAPPLFLSETNPVDPTFIQLSEDSDKYGASRPRIQIEDAYLDAVVEEVPDALYTNSTGAAASGNRRLANYGRATFAYDFEFRLPLGALKRGDLVSLDGVTYRVLSVQNDYNPDDSGVQKPVRAVLWR